MNNQTIYPTFYPTSAPTANVSTIIPENAENVGTQIGVGIIVGIIISGIVAAAVLFQKLICFKIFDTYGAERGIMQDICSCYKKDWREARRDEHEHSTTPKSTATPTPKQKDTHDDSFSFDSGNGGSVSTSGAVVTPSRTTDIELTRLAANTMQTQTSYSLTTHHDQPNATALAGEYFAADNAV